MLNRTIKDPKDLRSANMTDPKKSKELENLLRCRERITLLGHFVAGIAHEIIDPLSESKWHGAEFKIELPIEKRMGPR